MVIEFKKDEMRMGGEEADERAESLMSAERCPWDLKRTETLLRRGHYSGIKLF